MMYRQRPLGNRNGIAIGITYLDRCTEPFAKREGVFGTQQYAAVATAIHHYLQIGNIDSDIGLPRFTKRGSQRTPGSASITGVEFRLIEREGKTSVAINNPVARGCSCAKFGDAEDVRIEVARLLEIGTPEGNISKAGDCYIAG